MNTTNNTTKNKNQTNNNNQTAIENKQLSTTTVQDCAVLEECSVISVNYEESSTSSSSRCSQQEKQENKIVLIADLVLELENLEKISEFSTGKRQVASWKKKQVEVLEQLVLEFGTDFTRISQVMKRDRDQVKRKFKTMQKKNNNFGFVSQNKN